MEISKSTANYKDDTDSDTDSDFEEIFKHYYYFVSEDSKNKYLDCDDVSSDDSCNDSSIVGNIGVPKRVMYYNIDEETVKIKEDDKNIESDKQFLYETDDEESVESVHDEDDKESIKSKSTHDEDDKESIKSTHAEESIKSTYAEESVELVHDGDDKESIKSTHAEETVESLIVPNEDDVESIDDESEYSKDSLDDEIIDEDDDLIIDDLIYNQLVGQYYYLEEENKTQEEIFKNLYYLLYDYGMSKNKCYKVLSLFFMTNGIDFTVEQVKEIVENAINAALPPPPPNQDLLQNIFGGMEPINMNIGGRNMVFNFIPVDEIGDFVGEEQQLEDVISTLKSDDFSKLKEYKLEKSLDGHCPISLCDFEEGQTVIELPCSHIFEKDAILEYLKEYNYKCPVCRKECGSPEHRT